MMRHVRPNANRPNVFGGSANQDLKNESNERSISAQIGQDATSLLYSYRSDITTFPFDDDDG